MAKRFFLPLFLVIIGLLFPPSLMPTPFEMRVVDAQTGVGVPVRVTADNGVGRDTPNGYLYWWASSLMNRSVLFEIKDERHQFDNIAATIRVTPGGKATLKIRRRT